MRITSEITPLKKVILHQPALAIRRLTPTNCRDLLFDDVLWVSMAAQEHRFFQQVLEAHQVTVFLLQELLQDILGIPAARHWLLTKRLAQLYYQADIVDHLAYFLNEQSSAKLTEVLLGGITFRESGLHRTTLTANIMQQDDFLIPPLPNHLFTRDTSCWIKQGVVIGSMAHSARQAESLNLSAIYKFHPLFQENSHKVWFNGAQNMNLPMIEGGDIIVLNEHCLLIGLSQRTSADAVELLAKKLFLENQIQSIIAIEIPKLRASMHLDTMMTMIHHDMFAIAFLDKIKTRAWKISMGDVAGPLVICRVKNFFREIASVLGVNKIHLVTSAGDYFAEKREQWSDAANLLTIAPGEVIAYNRNVRMNGKLRKAGIVVHEIPSSELSRGRGGPRCMSCPLMRGEG